MLKNKKLRGILQIILSFGLLAIFIRKVGLGSIIEIYTTINFGWYFFAFLLFEINVVIRAYRWFILLHSLNERPSFGHLLYLYYLGFFANNFIPSGFGGDVVKVVNLRQRYGRGAEALSSVVMDRLTGLLGSSLIALIALTLNALGRTADINLPAAIWAIIALFSIGIPVGFLLLRWINILSIIERFIPAVRRLPRYNSLENLADTINRYPLPVLVKSLSISLPFTISLVLVQYAIAIALNVDLPLSLFFLFVPLIAIVNLLPIAFNGLGTREAVYQLLFVPMGVSASYAIAMSLAFYFLRFSTGLIGGLLFAVRSVLQTMRTPRVEKL
ncbi:MAG: flippase-like domain-containing protein [Chloroflexi bacterium]|nr:flippase-like domain-containing protein [Chloroflexota bacterium]